MENGKKKDKLNIPLRLFEQVKKYLSLNSELAKESIDSDVRWSFFFTRFEKKNRNPKRNLGQGGYKGKMCQEALTEGINTLGLFK